MTSAHLVFAIATTLYILIAIQLEERDLLGLHSQYSQYRQRVPMLLPLPISKRREPVRIKPPATQQEHATIVRRQLNSRNPKGAKADQFINAVKGEKICRLFK